MVQQTRSHQKKTGGISALALEMALREKAWEAHLLTAWKVEARIRCARDLNYFTINYCCVIDLVYIIYGCVIWRSANFLQMNANLLMKLQKILTVQFVWKLCGIPF